MKKLLLTKKTILTAQIVALLGFLLYANTLIKRSHFYENVPLTIRWEGFYKDKNYRDLGQSLNACLGTPLFKEGLITRANGWFSGWSCDQVGNPDVIYSLNYTPKKREVFYCWDQHKPVVGRYFNPDIQLEDLEFIKTWDQQDVKEATCRFLEAILESISHAQKSLLHCDAGRDRTGTVSALLAALAAEQAGVLDQKMLDAIECDYRKTESLVPEKYGRMASFLTNLKESGGVAYFLNNQCGFETRELTTKARHFINHDFRD